jgi:hypothetical protein
MKHKGSKDTLPWSNFVASRPLEILPCNSILDPIAAPLQLFFFSSSLHVSFAPARYIATIATI